MNESGAIAVPPVESEIFCETPMEIPVQELVFHIFALAQNRKRGPWTCGRERHEHHELIYTMHGGGLYEIGGKEYPVRRGSFWFVPRNVLHDGRSTGRNHEWQTLVIQMDFSLSRDPNVYLDNLGIFPAMAPFYQHFILNQQPVLHAPHEIQPQIDLIVERLSMELREKSAEYELALQSSLIELLLLVCRAARQTNVGAPMSKYAPKAKRLFRLERARRFLQENYTRDLKLDDIAAEACLSPCHFVRLFKQAFGMTPIQYQGHLRITEAKRLLQHAGLPVSEVGYRLGYSCPEYFSRCFSAKVGLSPTEYIRRSGGSSASE